MPRSPPIAAFTAVFRASLEVTRQHLPRVGHHSDAALGLGLCQRPCVAIILSASFGPQLPRSYGRARWCVLRTGSTTPQAASTASSRVKSAPSPAMASLKTLVGRFFSQLFFEQVELSLLPDEFLPCDLDASGESDCRAGGEPETQIVGAACRRRGVGEKPLRRRLQLHQDRSRGLGQVFAGAQVPWNPLPAP